MKYEEFNEIISKDIDLQKKYEETKAYFANEGIKDLNEISSKAAAKLGYAVSASEFQLNKIAAKELNNDELAAVTGGRERRDECRHDFTDTSCFMTDYCNVMSERYWLTTCVYDFIGYCAMKDACSAVNSLYYCNGNYSDQEKKSLCQTNEYTYGCSGTDRV